MAFFKKLKERLFKSSSKIDEGLDAIVEDGGEAEEVELDQTPTSQKVAADLNLNDQADIEIVQSEPPSDQNLSTEVESVEPEKQKETFVEKILGRRKEKVIKRKFDDDMLEQLEELLISSDMGVDTAMRVAANMAQGNLGSRFSTSEIKKLLADEIEQNYGERCTTTTHILQAPTSCSRGGCQWFRKNNNNRKTSQPIQRGG